MLLESFFLDRLMRQRQASPLTIASYRNTFRLLMQYELDSLLHFFARHTLTAFLRWLRPLPKFFPIRE